MPGGGVAQRPVAAARPSPRERAASSHVPSNVFPASSPPSPPARSRSSSSTRSNGRHKGEAQPRGAPKVPWSHRRGCPRARRLGFSPAPPSAHRTRDATIVSSRVQGLDETVQGLDSFVHGLDGGEVPMDSGWRGGLECGTLSSALAGPLHRSGRTRTHTLHAGKRESDSRAPKGLPPGSAGPPFLIRVALSSPEEVKVPRTARPGSRRGTGSGPGSRPRSGPGGR